ncbi:MAG: hypothetical protein IGS23_14080 [Rivularia sp. T60_A2020_040]|nr:hypothetical protein [Rivularia sp. T60_A2020_040]
MAALKILTSALKSRAVRKLVGNGTGKRVFSGTAIKKSGSASTDQVNSIWSSLNRFLGGFLSNALGSLFSGISITLNAIWRGVIQAFQFAWNFNWNITDQELDKNLVSKFNSLGSNFGNFAGNSMGYLLCGALPGALIATFNQPLASIILEEVGAEAYEQLIGDFSGILKSSANYLGAVALTNLFKNIRNLIRGTEVEFRRKLLFNGAKIEDIEKAVAKRNKPFVIAEKVEEKIASIDNEFLRNFASSFLESLGESCVEAGFVVTGRMDEYFAKQRESRDPLFGAEKTIEVTFDDNDQPKITVQSKVVDFVPNE